MNMMFPHFSKQWKTVCAGLVFLSLPLLADPVTVGGETVMRVPAAKARLVQLRIDQKLELGADAQGILAKKTEDGYGVYWGSTLLINVDKDLAAESQSEPGGLAKIWAQRLYDFVSLGMLKVSPKSLVLPMGKAATLNLSGFADGPVKVDGSGGCLLYTSPSPRDQRGSRMPSSA